MARFGIALGAGGAKGLAHVLMLEALDEMGLRPVCVAATSIGAVIGVLYCSGQSGREIRESIKRMVPRNGDSFRDGLRNKPLFPWLEFIAPQFDGTGLFKAERFISRLFESIEATSFDQLAIPLRVVAADFWSREEVVFEKGPLQRAVQASMSLPGLFSPVVIGDRVLIDGGAVNPVPFDLLPPDCTLTAAVDVIGQRGHAQAELPSLSEAIFNTFQIMEKSIVHAKLRSTPPDIYVEVESVDIRVLDFHKADRIFAQATRAKDYFKREVERRLLEQREAVIAH
jgi:NTE family protein